VTERENILRAVRFERPERIPMVFHINASCWNHYPGEALRELMATHPLLFPRSDSRQDRRELSLAPTDRAGQPHTDPWGCVWETRVDGISGTVTHNALSDWSAFADFAAPDPATTDGRVPLDWEQVASGYDQAKREGRLASGGLPHGHTFMTLMYLRGYENLLFDMADGDRRLHQLIDRIEQFNLAVVQRYLDAGAEWMGFAEDLGMQVGPMLSPEHLRRFIKPSYQRLMAPARAAGCIIHMHSDGDIRQLADHLIEGGVEVINLQDLVNGIGWIREHLSGRVCVDLDIDRQQITRFGEPEDIDALIHEEVVKLGSREGGLMMIFGLYPGTPLANVAAVMDAMERYSGHYS
jgi:uroporphyrinogen decarboxylase